MTGIPGGDPPCGWRRPPAGRLRVLFVTPGRPEGNNMIFARASADAMRSLGVEIAEFYLLSRTHPAQVGRDLLRLRKCVRRFDPMIVHAQYGGVTALVAFLAAGRRRKFMTVRGSDLNTAPSLGRLRGRMTRLLTLAASLWADEVICVSSSLKTQLGKVGGRCHVIASGVDTAVFFPADQRAARASADLPVGTPVVLFNAGKAPTLKGLSLVETAIDIVRSATGEVLLCVTRGDLSRREVAVLMNAADCLALASESEGSPNVVKEAMACNLPVVSVRVGDVAERLATVSPSCIVDRTPAALAAGIAHILSLRRRSNGFEQIRVQRLTQEDAAESLERLYASASQAPARDSRPSGTGAVEPGAR